jgi:ATP-binding cassette subfamily C (CFTR/MRP) protein 10
LISPLNAFPWVINGLVESHVSLKRVQRFINIQPTYLDEYYENASIDPLPSLGEYSLLVVLYLID